MTPTARLRALRTRLAQHEEDVDDTLDYDGAYERQRLLDMDDPWQLATVAVLREQIAADALALVEELLAAREDAA